MGLLSYLFVCLVDGVAREVFFLFIIGDICRSSAGFRQPLKLVLIVSFIPLLDTPCFIFPAGVALDWPLLSGSVDMRRHFTLICNEWRTSLSEGMLINVQTLVLLKWTSSCLLSSGRITLMGLATMLIDGGFVECADPQRAWERQTEDASQGISSNTYFSQIQFPDQITQQFLAVDPFRYDLTISNLILNEKRILLLQISPWLGLCVYCSTNRSR